MKLYQERTPGRIVQVVAAWRQVSFSGFDSSSSFLPNITLSGLVNWRKVITKAFQSDKFQLYDWLLEGAFMSKTVVDGLRAAAVVLLTSLGCSTPPMGPSGGNWTGDATAAEVLALDVDDAPQAVLDATAGEPPDQAGAADQEPNSATDSGNEGVTDAAEDDLGAPDLDAGTSGTDDTVQVDTAVVDAGKGDSGTGDSGKSDAVTVDAVQADTAVVDSNKGDNGVADSGKADAETVDAAAVDTGALDSAAMDVGKADAATVDSSTDDEDIVDAAAEDAAVVDSGKGDSGVADSGPADSGPVDAGSADNACTAKPAKNFEKFFGVAGTDEFATVLAMPDGGWLFVGSHIGAGSGFSDGWLLRTGPSGDILWQNSYGGPNNDAFFAAADNGDDTVTLTGFTDVNGTHEVWIVKVDSAGGLLFNYYLAGKQNEIGRAIVVNPSGWLVAGERSWSLDSWGYLAQISPNGGLQWEKQLDNFHDLSAVAASGAEYLVLGKANVPQVGYEAMVQRFTATNAVAWSVAFGSPAADSGGTLTAMSDGSFIATGISGLDGGKLMLRRLSANGGTVVSVNPAPLPMTSVRGAALVGGRLVVAGVATVNQQGDAVIAAFNVDKLSIDWQLQIAPSPYYDDGLAGVAAGAGVVALAGYGFVADGNQTQGWALVLDNNGHLGCVCEVGCSDGNSCTSDSCYLGVCLSSVVKSGTLCSGANGSPGKCNASGLCVTTCGDGACGLNETPANCPADCKVFTGHPCDSPNACGFQPVGVSCHCDAKCKTYHDCCDATGNFAKTCVGSTCAVCQ